MKYVYEVQDSNGKVTFKNVSTRKEAREYKGACDNTYDVVGKSLGEVPPYKIVRFEKVNPKVIR